MLLVARYATLRRVRIQASPASRRSPERLPFCDAKIPLDERGTIGFEASDQIGQVVRCLRHVRRLHLIRSVPSALRKTTTEQGRATRGVPADRAAVVLQQVSDDFDILEGDDIVDRVVDAIGARNATVRGECAVAA